ncbi:hypothetical protein WP12_20305 [Sphingomonas sp. SRS2]|nr:hypothetical protein WP12_20305 [Sphingomonas sp. SRS2]
MIAAFRRTLRAPVERGWPRRRAQGAQPMFTDIWIARRSALSLSKTLMVVTLVIAVGQQFAVITAEDADGDVAIVQEFDPFA